MPIAISKNVHGVTKGDANLENDKTYGNASKITVKNEKKLKQAIKAGKKIQIKTKVTYLAGKHTTHRKIAYESSNEAVATVSSTGVIKAKKKGSCYIYVYTQDGLSKKITGTVTSVTDEDGNDISTEVKRKQFYTIVTADGQQYYLVIDMSAAYTDDDGVNVTPDDGTVYFLTSVSNQNLLNFVDGNEQTLPQNSIAANNSIDDETVTPEMDESTEATTEEEPEPVEKKKSSGSNLILYVIVGLVAFVVIGVKVLGGKKGKADQNDDELYGEGEEEEDEPEPLESLDETEE